MLSRHLVRSAEAHAVSPVSGARHRPVLVDVGLPVGFQETYRWNVEELFSMGPWAPSAISEFDDALDACDIDRAWQIWHDAAGGSAAKVCSSELWGGWSSGARDPELKSLWKAMRRQLFDGRVDAARLSTEAITSLIDDANEARLVKWKASVRSRGGAARWIASKMKLRRSPPLPSFDSAVFSASQLARKLAKEFADRWNVGCYTLKRGSSCFVGVGSSPPLACHPIIQPPPPLRPSRIDLSLFDHVPAYEPPGTWSPDDVLRHTPDGTLGLEGHSAELFQQLHLIRFPVLHVFMTWLIKDTYPPSGPVLELR